MLKRLWRILDRQAETLCRIFFCLMLIIVCLLIAVTPSTTSHTPTSYPLDYWIDDLYEVDEEYAIRSAAEHWNRDTGRDLLRYRGRINVDEFRRPNRSDGKSIIYKIVRPTEETDRIQEDISVRHSDRHKELVLRWWGSASRGGDVSIYWHNFIDDDRWGEHAEELVSLEDNEDRQRLLYSLEALSIHEMGHVLGLDHNENQDSTMRLRQTDNYPESLYIPEIDVAAFCILNPCPERKERRDE